MFYYYTFNVTGVRKKGLSVIPLNHSVSIFIISFQTENIKIIRVKVMEKRYLYLNTLRIMCNVCPIQS